MRLENRWFAAIGAGLLVLGLIGFAWGVIGLAHSSRVDDRLRTPPAELRIELRSSAVPESIIDQLVGDEVPDEAQLAALKQFQMRAVQKVLDIRNVRRSSRTTALTLSGSLLAASVAIAILGWRLVKKLGVNLRCLACNALISCTR